MFHELTLCVERVRLWHNHTFTHFSLHLQHKTDTKSKLQSLLMIKKEQGDSCHIKTHTYLTNDMSSFFLSSFLKLNNRWTSEMIPERSTVWLHTLKHTLLSLWICKLSVVLWSPSADLNTDHLCRNWHKEWKEKSWNLFSCWGCKWVLVCI